MKVKVISLNLWEGGNLFEEIVNFLQKENPDILILQEVYNGDSDKLDIKYRSLNALKESLDYEFVDYSVSFIDNRDEGRIPSGNAVFSKFPVIRSETKFYNRPLDEHYVEKVENFPNISRNLQMVALQTPAGEVNVFNVHGVWDLEGDKYTEQRKNMRDVIIDAIDGKSNVILAGDTNATLKNKVISDIGERLTSVFGNQVVTTFNMQRKTNSGYATAAVDVIFVSNEFAILSSSIPKVDISDHLPLIANLEIENL